MYNNATAKPDTTPNLRSPTWAKTARAANQVSPQAKRSSRPPQITWRYRLILFGDRRSEARHFDWMVLDIRPLRR